MGAQVDLVELVPKEVEWNREFLKDLNGALLDVRKYEIELFGEEKIDGSMKKWTIVWTRLKSKP